MKICENCGTISEFSDGECKACCNSKITDLKISTQEWFNLTPTQKETVIKNTLSLSDETYELIQEAWRNNKKNVQPMSRPIQTNFQQNTPKCPICQSTNLSKITTVQKAGKIALFGIFGMSDNGKTWRCNNCGSKF